MITCTKEGRPISKVYVTQVIACSEIHRISTPPPHPCVILATIEKNITHTFHKARHQTA